MRTLACVQTPPSPHDTLPSGKPPSPIFPENGGGGTVDRLTVVGLADLVSQM